MMACQSASRADRPIRCRPLILALLLVILVCGQGANLLDASAQGSRWECPSPAAVDATPVGTPVTTDEVQVAFPPEGGVLRVFAAASLTDAFGAIEQELEEANQNLSITYNFGGSQALVTQLKEGPQAD